MRSASVLRGLLLAGLLTQLFAPRTLRADSGYDAWLRYARLTEAERAKYSSFPGTVIVLNDSAFLQSAEAELIRGVRGMLGRTLRVVKGSPPRESSIILGTLAELHSIRSRFAPAEEYSHGRLLAYFCTHPWSAMRRRNRIDGARNALRSFRPASQDRVRGGLRSFARIA
jgi:Glycosyl hydrolase family 67 N-terminus